MESLYQCKRCGYECNHKHAMQRHFKRKKVCLPTLANIDVSSLLTELNTVTKEVQDKSYECEYCGVKFKHRSTKCTHKKICKAKATAKEDHPIIIRDPDTKLLHAEIAELKSMIMKQQSNTTYNHCNVINVNNFGEENIDHLMRNFKYYFVNKAHGLIEAIKDIHFDPNHPENHTVTIRNKREKVATIREKGKWVSKPYKEVAEDLMLNISMKVERFTEGNTEILESLCNDIERLQKWWNLLGTAEFNEKEYDHIVKRILDTIIECKPNITIQK